MPNSEHTMNAAELADFYGGDGYWGEHPHYSDSDWRHEVIQGHTRRSYWQWVESRIDEAETENTDD